MTCTLEGTTAAVCAGTLSASVDGDATATSVTRTLDKENIHFYSVPITASVGKLADLGSCTLSVNGAAATGLGQVYKVIVVHSAAALLAGALM